MFSKVMTLILAGVILMLGVFLGCDEEAVLPAASSVSQSQIVKPDIPDRPVLFSTQLPSSRVDILGYSVDSDKRGVSIEMNACFEESSPAQRTLNIGVSDDSEGRTGFRCTLTNSRQELLWEFDARVDPEDEGHTWLTERSGADALTLERLHTDDSLVEVYTLNGIEERFHFATGDVEWITSLRDEAYSEGYILHPAYNRLSTTDKRIAETFVEFESFYDWNNSLHNNEEGVLVSEFITSQSVADWFVNEFPSTGIGAEEALTERWADICDLAFATAGLKCPYGGQYNPACVLALGVLIICIIASLF